MPNFQTMSDVDLTGLVAWCEKWKMEEVYNTAFKQAFMDGDKFVDWVAKDYPALPLPVRAELKRAAMINFESGRMFRLQIAHLFIEGWRVLIRHSIYAFFAFLIAYLIIR
jgi:hypothetical protein